MPAYGRAAQTVWLRDQNRGPTDPEFRDVTVAVNRGGADIELADGDYLLVGFERRLDALILWPELSRQATWEFGVPSARGGEVEFREFVPYPPETGRLVSWRVPEGSSWQPGTITGTVAMDMDVMYWLKLSGTGIQVDSLAVRPYAYIASAEDVQHQLQRREAFDDDTLPSDHTVEQYIRGAEDSLYRVAGRSYRPEYIRAEEIQFKPYGMPLRWRPILEVMNLEIWEGNGWGSHGEGRDEEWHYIAETGIVHLSSIFLGVQIPPTLRRGYSERRVHGAFRRGVRVEYIHGYDERENPYVTEVTRIAVKQAVIDLSVSYDFADLIPQGLDRVSLNEKIRLWTEEVNGWKDRYARLSLY